MARYRDRSFAIKLNRKFSLLNNADDDEARLQTVGGTFP